MNPFDFIKEIAATLEIGIKEDDAHLRPLLEKINDYLARPEDCAVIPKDKYEKLIKEIKTFIIRMHKKGKKINPKNRNHGELIAMDCMVLSLIHMRTFSECLVELNEADNEIISECADALESGGIRKVVLSELEEK